MYGPYARPARWLCLAVSVCLIAGCLSVERGQSSQDQEGRMETGHADGKNVQARLDRFTTNKTEDLMEDNEEEEEEVEDEDERDWMDDEEWEEVGTAEEEQQCGVNGLRKVKDQVLQMISDRNRMKAEMVLSLDITKKNADKARQDLLLFTNSWHTLLKRVYQSGLKEIETGQQLEASRVTSLFMGIKHEVWALEKLDQELETLLHSLTPFTDNVLKFVPQLCKPPAVTDWSEVSTHQDPMEGTIIRASSEVDNLLGVLLDGVVATELYRIQKCAVDVTVDSRTSHPLLVISGDGKRVSVGSTAQFPHHPQRFHPILAVLGNEGFRSGRFYYEVLVRDKTVWFLGVARKSVHRKGEIDFKTGNGYWTVSFSTFDGYVAHADTPEHLSLSSPPQKVGVFVDYERGQVSFYDVDNRSHIYSYSGELFIETVYPFFIPGANDSGENAAPLVITPVSQTQ